jgi:uncharacterized protein YkvS
MNLTKNLITDANCVAESVVGCESHVHDCIDFNGGLMDGVLNVNNDALVMDCEIVSVDLEEQEDRARGL